jgi:DNA-binding MarR family transcriptional regulator
MSEPRWLSDAEQGTWRAFLELTRRLDSQLDRDLQRDAGMPLAYYVILSMLSEAPGRTLRMSQLAQLTWSSRSRLSHAADRLEEKGWVRRDTCAADRRGAWATLTDDGLTVLEAAAPSHVESVRRLLFDQLTPAQVGALGEISRIVAARLAALPDAAPCD